LRDALQRGDGAALEKPLMLPVRRVVPGLETRHKMMAMEFIDLPQLLSAQGTVRLPGSKSISNRCCCSRRWPKGNRSPRSA
jgi:hypothetical protein